MKRDYTKFFTCPDTATFMANLLNPKDGDVILEPSAGNGALVKSVKYKNNKSIVFAVELYPEWENDLRKAADVVVIKDFLQFTDKQPKYSGCIANPPFGNETDLQAHFDKACNLVKTGGKIVMILPDDFEVKKEHKSYPLQNWGTNKDGTVTPIKIVEFFN